jgi:hypothetical protein
MFDAGVVEKFVPWIVTVVPTAPDVGDRLVIVGDAALMPVTQSNKTENARLSVCFHALMIIETTSEGSAVRWGS